MGIKPLKSDTRIISKTDQRHAYFAFFKPHLKQHQQQRGGAEGLATTTASEGLWSANLSGNSVGEISR